LLEISRADLAKAASVGERTIADFESRTREPLRATLAAIQRALEAAGVEFLPDNGVRLLRQVDAKPASGGPAPAKKPRTAGKPCASGATGTEDPEGASGATGTEDPEGTGGVIAADV